METKGSGRRRQALEVVPMARARNPASTGAAAGVNAAISDGQVDSVNLTPYLACMSRDGDVGTGFVHRYGPWAVVTGASNGIGRAVATELASAGLHLVLVARGEVELHRFASELHSAHGVQTRVLPMDLAPATAGAELVSATSDLDVGLVVAAAGFGRSGCLIDAPIDEELSMLDVNCRAVLVLAHGFGQRLAARGRGGMILFGSLVGWQGVPNAANYAATKAYIQSLAEGLRSELAPSGVDVLSVAPGPVRSGFAERAGMVMGGTDTPGTVARAAVTALGRRGTSVPGGRSKLLTWSLAPLPRRVRVSIMGRIMSGMVAGDGQRDAAA